MTFRASLTVSPNGEAQRRPPVQRMKAAASALESAGFTSLVRTADARQVLPLVRQHAPDLILLDLHMPHRHGLDLLRDLREATPAGDYRPVLVLTADVNPDTRDRALSLRDRAALRVAATLALRAEGGGGGVSGAAISRGFSPASGRTRRRGRPPRQCGGGRHRSRSAWRRSTRG